MHGSYEPIQPDEDAEQVKTLKAASQSKRLSDRSAFFTWAHKELQVTKENPADGLEERRQKLTQQAKDENTGNDN
jgi:site-specific recombinase XerC